MTYRPTPADKARKTRTRNLADALQFALWALAKAKGTEADVVALFRSHRVSPVRRAEAYDLLDSNPRLFGEDYSGWHSLLRRTRNHSVHGPELFATFRSK